jgi:hypothetical protein
LLFEQKKELILPKQTLLTRRVLLIYELPLVGGLEEMEPTKVAVRYINGTVIKGFIQNFSPNKDRFHLIPADKSSGGTIEVSVNHLKAVFIVRDFMEIPSIMNGRSILKEKTLLVSN